LIINRRIPLSCVGSQQVKVNELRNSGIPFNVFLACGRLMK
jgi:hypothetical protein